MCHEPDHAGANPGNTGMVPISSLTQLPLVLADLHRAADETQPVVVDFPVVPDEHDGVRLPSLDDIIVGGGFVRDADGLSRVHTLPDTVGTGMRLLICGLNPSPASADSGVGFHRPGNRFWPAALAAGLTTEDRDPLHALTHHGLGMTDLVKRTTRKASELAREEYRDGHARVERLVRWLQPGAVCFVGLAGWRAAVDRKAAAGPQERPLGDRPVYLMPSTSGLNASSQLPDFTEHLRNALALAGSP